MDIKKTFAENLKRYRKERNMTQEELAKLSQVAVNSIRSYEQAKANATLENIGQIAKVLNVTIGALCDDNKPQAPSITSYADLVSALVQFKSLFLDAGVYDSDGRPQGRGRVQIDVHMDKLPDDDPYSDFPVLEVQYCTTIQFVDKTLYDFFSSFNQLESMEYSTTDEASRTLFAQMKQLWLAERMKQLQDTDIKSVPSFDIDDIDDIDDTLPF